ncbi:hypothetical protein [Sphingomonas sp. Mn802worker]|uniref:hypothetical protein n=1 Tax=Sphingomonas sp. Mn802worker TaxID=629773 RepID=UPI0003794CF6|nr:hypothetical protein [Sphingomonas sp. Mn802worker]
MIAAAALLALAGPAAAVCKGAPQAPAADFLADETAHRALRDETGVAMPTDPEHITIYAAGGHLATTRISIVATRAADGLWHTDAVGRSKIWVEGAMPSDMPHVTRTLSIEDGARIDALLDQPAFWRQELSARDNEGPPPLGLMVRRIDVVTPNCAQHWATAGDQPSMLAELDALITPK